MQTVADEHGRVYVQYARSDRATHVVRMHATTLGDVTFQPYPEYNVTQVWYPSTDEYYLRGERTTEGMFGWFWLHSVVECRENPVPYVVALG